MSQEHGLVKRIDSDVIAAMKARDAVRLETLRMVKSALKNREIDKREPLTEAEAQATLTTLIKQRRESIEQFNKGGRPELAAKEAGEIALIETYMPQAASEAELRSLVEQVLEALTASGERLSPKDIGLVMKAAQERIRETGIRAEGRQLSDLIKSALAQSA